MHIDARAFHAATSSPSICASISFPSSTGASYTSNRPASASTRPGVVAELSAASAAVVVRSLARLAAAPLFHPMPSMSSSASLMAPRSPAAVFCTTSMCSPSSSSSCAAISAIVCCCASPALALPPPIGPLNLPAAGRSASSCRFSDARCMILLSIVCLLTSQNMSTGFVCPMR
ncbi:hypothetical protein BC826DRAFT_1048468, partial [Russula brevipes]